MLKGGIKYFCVAVILIFAVSFSGSVSVVDYLNKTTDAVEIVQASKIFSGEMMISSSAAIPTISQTPQAAPAARGGGSVILFKLSATSILRERQMERSFKISALTTQKAKTASLEPLKRYFVYTLREIII